MATSNRGRFRMDIFQLNKIIVKIEFFFLIAEGTKDIGSALTRLCLRQKSVTSHLKTFANSIMDCLVLPLQDRLDEWKKTTAQMDKEHLKECKRFRQEWKKRSTMDLADQSIYQSVQQLQQHSPSDYTSTSDPQQSLYGTLRLQKKFRLRSGNNNFNTPNNESLGGSNGCLNQLDASERLLQFEMVERNALKRVLIEERSRFCLFVHYLKSVLDEQLLLTQEVSHLQEVMEQLTRLSADPYAEVVIANARLSKNQRNNFDANALYGLIGNPFPAILASNTPPNSPGLFGSRKSSSCSLSSFNSFSSAGHNSLCGHGMQQPVHQSGSHTQPNLSQNYTSRKNNPMVCLLFFYLFI